MTESARNADFRRKPQIFADSPLLLEIPAFGGRRKPQKTADFRRKPKIFAENRRKPQIGLRHLRCVTFSSALENAPQHLVKSQFYGDMEVAFLEEFIPIRFVVSDARLHWGCSNDPLTVIPLHQHCDTNGRCIVIQIGGVYAFSSQKEGIICKSIRDGNGRRIMILFKSIGVRGRIDSLGAPLLGRAKKGGGGQNVPKSKTSRGWPVGNHFSTPSENGFLRRSSEGNSGSL